MARIALIGCGKLKLDVASPAGDLYVGQLFRSARAYAEKHCDRWFILSAKHGLLDPATVIEPYDLALSKLSGAELRAWSAEVQLQIAGNTHHKDKFVLLAGGRYCSAVEPFGRRVESPLTSLGIGQRLRWFKENT